MIGHLCLLNKGTCPFLQQFSVFDGGAVAALLLAGVQKLVIWPSPPLMFAARHNNGKLGPTTSFF